MQMETLRKIIELHLKGFGYTEISKRTGIARSTVQDAVAKWRSGNTGIFGEAVSYVDEITEIARYLRGNGVRLEDIKMPILSASVLKSLNVDLEDLYSFYDTVKDYGPDVVRALAKTVIELQSHGLDPAGMVRKLESLGNEISDLENRKGQLEQEVSSIEAVLSDKNRAKESLEKEVSDLRTVSANLAKQKKDMTDQIKRNRDRIAKSDRFWSAAEAMGIDPVRVAEFMETARSMGYDAKTIPGIREVEKYATDRSMSADEMHTLVMSLRQLNSAGWSANRIISLAATMGDIADTPDAVIGRMRDYSIKYRDVAMALADLDKQLSEARYKHEMQMGILKSMAEKLAGQIAAAREEKDSIENEIRELIGKRQEAEASYTAIENEIKRIFGSVVTLDNLKDAIDRQTGLKRNLESSIAELKERLAGLRIAADVAAALPSVITGKDMKLKDLCAAFISGRDVPGADADAIRERIINDLIEISAGGIVPVRYATYHRLISGRYYERLMQLDRERGKIAEERMQLTKIMELYGSDIRSYLDDYLAGRIPAYSLGYAMIREIAEETFRKKVETAFSDKVLKEIAGNRTENSLLFLVAPDAASGSPVVGSISTSELVEAINSGSDRIILDTHGGRVPIDRCYALMQILAEYLEPSLLEALRREYRESILRGRSGIGLRFGGIIIRGENGKITRLKAGGGPDHPQQ